jgi:plasmid stability protein
VQSPDYVKVTVNVDANQLALLKARAQLNGRSVGAECRILLDTALALQSESIAETLRLIQTVQKQGEANVPSGQ